MMSSDSSCAYALVNGMQLLHCVLPTASERMCVVEEDAQQNLGVMEDFGRFEISCLFYAGTGVSATDHPYAGELIVDGQAVIELGQLPGGDGSSSTIVTRYVAEYPKVLELRLRYVQKTVHSHPDETELLFELEELLSDATLFTPGGSAPYTNVHNHLKGLEVFNRVVTQHYNGKFIAFLAKHSDRVLMHKESGAELHLMLKGNESTYVKVDQEAEERRAEQEGEVVKDMINVLRERDYDYYELMQRLTQLPGFSSQLTPSINQLLRVLLSHRDIFWVRKDAEHTTRVGLVHH